ncbi:MAG: hypothetical protein FWC89_09870 [Defluviitaleaceae bacterium]|nr:hypothetical protein [Defluviitaleaceae bacterium]
MAEDDKIYWHEAFQEVLQLELHQYAEFLEFENDHKLSEEALRMDVVVIKKDKDVKIEKNIGKIFKGRNIFEYKSETVTFSQWDYNKVIGYAFLYSSFMKIPITDITISVVLTIYPQKLVKHLEDERGFKVLNLGDGIHYVQGDNFPIQILESKNLSPNDNLFLRNLRRNISPEDMAKILKSYKEHKPLEKTSVYLDRLIQANLNIYKEVANMSFKDICMDMAVRNGWEDNFADMNKTKQAVKRLFALVDSPEKIAEIMDIPIEKVMQWKQEAV